MTNQEIDKRLKLLSEAICERERNMEDLHEV